MVGLRLQNVVNGAALDRLMSVAGNEERDLRKLGRDRHHAVGEIIAAGARLQSNPTGQYDSIGSVFTCLCNRAANRFDRMLKFEAAREFRPKPKRHPWGGNTDNRNLDP